MRQIIKSLDPVLPILAFWLAECLLAFVPPIKTALAWLIGMALEFGSLAITLIWQLSRDTRNRRRDGVVLRCRRLARLQHLQAF